MRMEVKGQVTALLKPLPQSALSVSALRAALARHNEMFIQYKIRGHAARTGSDLFATSVILIFTLAVVDEAQLQVSVVVKSANTEAIQFLASSLFKALHVFGENTTSAVNEENSLRFSR